MSEHFQVFLNIKFRERMRIPSALRKSSRNYWKSFLPRLVLESLTGFCQSSFWICLKSLGTCLPGLFSVSVDLLQSLFFSDFLDLPQSEFILDLSQIATPAPPPNCLRVFAEWPQSLILNLYRSYIRNCCRVLNGLDPECYLDWFQSPFRTCRKILSGLVPKLLGLVSE